jgi:very-short-patch-repair endonuclease
VERLLWFALRGRRFAGHKFRRQVPIGHYIADFACWDASLIVELDGGQHGEHVAADQRRTEWFLRNGWRVLRFWNNDVIENMEGVLQRVAQELTIAPRPHPGPLPHAGEGDTAS